MREIKKWLRGCGGHGAWGVEHGAWGMEHGAWGMEHGAWGMGQDKGNKEQ